MKIIDCTTPEKLNRFSDAISKTGNIEAVSDLVKIILYDVEINDEREDIEEKSEKDAIKYAYKKFAEECESDGIEDGEIREDEVVVIAYYFNDDGSETIISRKTVGLEYEGERSDYDEHNTHWGKP